MPETMPRSRLDVDRLYYCIPDQQWISTPDGVGIHYHEDRAAGLEQTGTDEKHIGFINQRLADW